MMIIVITFIEGCEIVNEEYIMREWDLYIYIYKEEEMKGKLGGKR